MILLFFHMFLQYFCFLLFFLVSLRLFGGFGWKTKKPNVFFVLCPQNQQNLRFFWFSARKTKKTYGVFGFLVSWPRLAWPGLPWLAVAWPLLARSSLGW